MALALADAPPTQRLSETAPRASTPLDLVAAATTRMLLLLRLLVLPPPLRQP